MRPSKAWSSHLTTGLTLCFTVLFSFSIMYAQGMSSRLPSGARYGNSLPSLDALAAIQADAIAPPHIRPQAETISIHELLLPAGAVKEFQRSEKAVRSGDFRSAAEHLRSAIQIAPLFVQAHNNLGATYIQLNEYESGVAEFRAAIALDPKIEESHRNLGLGLFLLRRYPEAELAARQALQLNSQRSSARYTLGRILAAEGVNAAEAEQLLRQTVGEYPEARLPLAQVLLNTGATTSAAAELREYLKSTDADMARKRAVQSWLDLISRAQAKEAVKSVRPAA
jgi:tetratricopeptide (TPR) repeat protein